MRRSSRRTSIRRVAAAFVAAALLVGSFVSVLVVAGSPAGAAGSARIAGSVFHDADRDGVFDAGEVPFEGTQLYLFDAAGTFVAAGASASDGSYEFAGLAAGSYGIQFESSAWWALRDTWVPTTTGSVWFRRDVEVTDTADAIDFGLRQIVWSDSLSAPVSSYTGAEGLRVDSFNDAVSARDVYDRLAAGSLLGREASSTVVHFAYSNSSYATTTVGGSPGSYTGFSATVWLDYPSWLDLHDQVLFHEYGHAWAIYHDRIVQQDGGYRTYLDARGLSGDPRLGTSKYWDPGEMIAEDYRLLFGTATAAAVPHANTEIPEPSEVPGLETFLRDGFATPLADSGGSTGGSTTGDGSTSSSSVEPVALAVSGLAVDPAPIVTSGDVVFDLSVDATASLTVLDDRGRPVRTLLDAAAVPGGRVVVSWDRTHDNGRTAKPGSYSAVVTAVDGSGDTVEQAVVFRVDDGSEGSSSTGGGGKGNGKGPNK